MFWNWWYGPQDPDKPAINKQELIATLINDGARYYSQKILASYSNKEVYVFFLSNNTIKRDDFDEVNDLFVELMKRSKRKKFLIADCDQPDGERLTKARVTHYQNGKLIKYEMTTNNSTAVPNSSGGHRSFPNGIHDNADDLFEDENDSSFSDSACSDHADDEVSVRREMNILIMGETGVGKSTWINGLVNYLNYEKMKDAEASELITLIPSSFTYTHKRTLESVKIVTGVDENEDHRAGQSATQSSRIYPFQIDDMLIKIIDTPGIADVRGVEQDNKNMENILSTISDLKELHGIVILLKPNNSRLTLMFRFCIEGLLMHLHNSAIDNIVFGFTNTRSTNYRPGQTLTSLRQLLAVQKANIRLESGTTWFCFDSESYRLLAALKNGIKFTKHDKESYSESWDWSVEETRRLFRRLAQLTPHPIKNTISLNNARQLIVELTKPMADITNNINRNVAVLEDRIKEVQETKKKGKDLEDSLKITVIQLVYVPVDMPRTVCTNHSCVEYLDFEGMKKIHYKTACHDPCYLTGVEINRKDNPALRYCAAMAGTSACRRSNCLHSYLDHMHIMYTLDEVSRQVEDKNLRSKINHYTSDAEKIQAHIDNLSALIAEYKEEQTEIEATAAKFGAFLKVNAIIPVSDARLEYLDHLIREEKGKVQEGGSPKLLETLQNSRDAYAQEVKAIVEAMARSGSAENTIDPTAIEVDVDKLYNLKHFGDSLKNIKNGMVAAFSKHYNNVAKVTIPKPKRRDKGFSFDKLLPRFMSGKSN